MEVLDNISIDRFLLVAFAKYILSQIYSHCIHNCAFSYFLEIVETFVFSRKYFQSLLIFIFFYPKTSNFHNAGMIYLRKLSDPSMNSVFNVLSIGLQYTLSFKRPAFGLKCLVTVTPKVQSLKFKASVWNIPISETGRNCNPLFKLDDDNWVVIIEQKRKMEYSWACTFRASQGFSRFQGFLGWSKI